jgi:hypothetical protein
MLAFAENMLDERRSPAIIVRARWALALKSAHCIFEDSSTLLDCMLGLLELIAVSMAPRASQSPLRIQPSDVEVRPALVDVDLPPCCPLEPAAMLKKIAYVRVACCSNACDF